MTTDNTELLRQIEVLQQRVCELEEALCKNDCSADDQYEAIDPSTGWSVEPQTKGKALLQLTQFIVDNAMDAAYWIDSDTQFLYVNNSACKMLGYSREELLTKSISDIEQKYSKEILLSNWKEFKEKKFLVWESLHKRKDGSIFPVDIVINYIQFGDKEYICAFARDITERKQSEEKLIEAEERFRTLVDQASEGFFLHDAGKIVDVNDAACEMLGYSREELMQLFIWDVDNKINQTEFTEVFWKELNVGRKFVVESEHLRKDGTLFPVELSVGHVELRGQRLILGLVRDITERKQAEMERLANLKFFESMDKVNRAIQGAHDFESMMGDVLDVVMSLFDCDRVVMQFPCDPEADSWSVPMSCTKPEYPRILRLGLMMPMEDAVSQTLCTVKNSDGPVKFGIGADHQLSDQMAENFGIKSFMATALYPKMGKPWLFGIQQCSHDRIWTAEEERLFQEIGRRLSDALTSLLTYRNLVKSEEFLSNIIENIPYMVLVKDANDLRYLRRNKACDNFTGRSNKEVIGKTDYDILPKEIADAVTANDYNVLRIKKFVDTPEVMFNNKDNEKRILHTKKIPILDKTENPQYLLVIAEDITDHKKLEAQLHQAQKMEAVGRLAGGVAHDFNNMIGVIIGHTDLCMEGLDPSHPLYVNLLEIQTAAERSANLTRQLLAFARKQTIIPKVLDLNETVEGMLKMLRRLIGEDIDLAWLPDTGIWSVKMDPSQIDQILANLCVNARDAICEVGKITIETENVTIDEIYSDTLTEFIPGEYVRLTVSDNGIGMDKETLNSLFEPFFTTKDKDKGTGLGLATVYGIVKQNNGFINVYSEPDHGSVFKIYLPRHTADTVQVKKEKGTVSALQGDETILLVEDEFALLNMAMQMLEKLGYKVLTAPTPHEAISTVENTAVKVDLLITDVVLPGMNGRELVTKIVSLCPDIKYLYMSGYTSNIITHHGKLDEGVNFIQKPFSLYALASKVREVIDGA
ncbi:MAG: PAS domain S-box protein [Pseudomonadota bacterium]